MKKLFFLILFFISIQSFGQRFPSVDSLQNYILRYVRNSTVETFTNLRMQNVVYGLSELLESRAVDSIWRVIGKDSIFFRKNGTTFAIKDSTGSTLPSQTGNNGKYLTTNGSVASWGTIPSYTAGNGLTLSGSQFRLGGTLNENTTIAYPFGIEFKVKSEGSQGNNNRIEYYAANGGFAIEGYNSGSIDKVLQISGSGVNLFYNNGAVNIGGNQIQFKNGTSNGVYSQTTTDTTASKPLVLNTSTGLVSRMTSWPSPSLTLQQVTDNGNTTNNGIYISDIYVQSSPSDTSLVLRYDVGGLDKGARFRFNKLSDESNNHYYFPNKSGTLPLSVRLNGTTYTSNDTGSIELGTISTDTTSLSNRINTKVNISDTASMLNGRLSSITLNTSSAIHTTPVTFSRVGGAWSGTLSLASQSPFTTFRRASGSGTPSFGSIDSNYFGGSFGNQAVTMAGNQTVQGRKTFNGQTFFNKDSVTRTTGRRWGMVLDTVTNTLMRQDLNIYRRDIDTIPLATFTVGSAAAGDTAAFSTSTLAGSFYLDGTDTLFVTSYRVALQGTSPSITPEVWFNDSLNITAGGTRLATGSAITNTAVGTSVTATTNKIPQGNWVFVRFSAVATKPTYFTLTLFGYRIRKA